MADNSAPKKDERPVVCGTDFSAAVPRGGLSLWYQGVNETLDITPPAHDERLSLAGPWHTQSPEVILRRLKSKPSGLTTSEAQQRLLDYGPNQLREAKPVSATTIFLAQFKSLIIWILIGAGLVSGALGEWVDSVAILAIVVLNALIGFYQDFKRGEIHCRAEEDDGAARESLARWQGHDGDCGRDRAGRCS